MLTYKGDTGILFVEQQLDISWITGEEDAVGTADAIVVRDGELIVIDLKTGHNNVDAKENDQLMGYAAAALRAYQLGQLVALENTPSLVSEAPAVEDDGDDLC